jgi:2'-5' RNA ligase
MRLFIGIPLADVVVNELAAFTQQLRAPDDGLRWSSPAGWHITLQFLGSATAEQCACAAAHLGEIHQSSFPIQLESPSFFDRAGVFFVGVQLSTQLVVLQKRVTAATAPSGFVAEDRPYHPHITLARSKGGRAALTALKPRIRNAPAFQSFIADEFILYESFPGAGGSRYEVRGRFPLLRV